MYKKVKLFFIKLIIITVALIFMALGVAAMRFSVFGIDPFSCMGSGINIFTGIGFGTAMLAQNIILLLVVLFFDKKKIGAGTVLNMVIIGYGSDFFLRLFQMIPTLIDCFFLIRIAALIVGIVIICFTAAVYIEANLGISPYDSAALIISEKMKKEKWYRWIRIITDFFCTGTGFLLGNIPGIGTIVMSLFTGPLIAFFREKAVLMFNKINIKFGVTACE